MADEAKELENKIYETYYKNNPNGDARFTVWPKVVKAKGDIEKLKQILEEVS